MKICKAENLFYLVNDQVALIMEEKEGRLFLRHFGGPIASYHHANAMHEMDHAFSPNPRSEDRTFSMDTQRQVLGQMGRGDFRKPSIRINHTNNQVTDFRYVDYQVLEGVPQVTGLPSPHAKEGQAQTLKLQLKDTVLDLYLNLYYTLYEGSATLTCFQEVVNQTGETIELATCLSAMLDLPTGAYDVISFQGAYGREKRFQRQALQQGYFEIGSSRGASGHGQTPAIILADRLTQDDAGQAYALQIMYSGNFQAFAQCNQLEEVRLGIGIHPDFLNWRLATGESFSSPVALMTYTYQGLNTLSQASQTFILDHIMPPAYSDQLRPILINNWEATYFDFNFDKLTQIIDKAQEVGIELFVLDDGWFGDRQDDQRALGDWVVNESKLGGPLSRLIDYVHDRGMKFGLWIEPEMISQESDLYRQHPDWVIQVPGRSHTYARSQLVLDYANPEVVAYFKELFGDLLSQYAIDYIKWDMNRNITDVGNGTSLSDTLMQPHRHLLGVYDLMAYLTQTFPHVLFESCAGGGGRNDLGVMRYFPQVWVSDNTDAIERLAIQHGHTYLYPTIAMGAHVSAVPNHQMNRTTPLKTRGDVAMTGNLGYELDLCQLSNEELGQVAQQVAFYKTIRPIIQRGQRTRLLDPEHFPNDWACQFSYQDQLIVFYGRVLSTLEKSELTLKLKNLDPHAFYQEQSSGKIYSGAELIYAGLTMVVPRGDFQTSLQYFKKIQ